MTTEDEPLFDLAGGQALAERGMTRALDAAEEWRTDAYAAIDYLAQTGRRFTSEDVVELVGLPNPDATDTNQNNAVGAIMNAAARRHMIHRVGWGSSRRKSSHAAALALWEGGPA